MTDDELRELVAGLAISQRKTDEQMARTDEQMARTDARIDRMSAGIDELRQMHKATEVQMARTDEQMARTDARIDRMWAGIEELRQLQRATDEQMARTDARIDRMSARVDKVSAKIDRLAEMYGGVGNNQGKATEEFYYNSLRHHPEIAGVRFDLVDKNITRARGDLEDEYDLVLINGERVFVVEVKYRVHPRDLTRLLERKGPNFRRLFPEYAGYRLQLGLATFSIDDPLREEALRRGVVVLQRRGNVIETLAA